MTLLTLIRGAQVFTPTPLGVRDMLLGGGEILAIAERIPLPPGEEFVPVRVVEARGLLALPGLVDAHCHIAGGGGEGGFVYRTPPVPFSHLTRAGITTVVGLLGTDAVTRSVQEVLATAAGYAALGLTAYAYTGAYPYPTRTVTGSVRSDIVLLDRVLGVGEIAISDARSSHPSHADLLRLALEARVGGLLAGKAGVVHLHVGDGPDGLGPVFRALADDPTLPVTQFVPTHLNRRAALLEQAVQYGRRGGYVDLTASIRPAPGDTQPVDPAEALAHLLEEGVPWRHITLSSDGGGSAPVFDERGHLVRMARGDPGSLWEAVRRAVQEKRVSLPVALAAATVNPATALGLARKGKLAPGLDADVLLVDEDLRIRHVFARGELLVADGTPTRWGPFEERESQGPPGH